MKTTTLERGHPDAYYRRERARQAIALWLVVCGGLIAIAIFFLFLLFGTSYQPGLMPEIFN